MRRSPFLFLWTSILTLGCALQAGASTLNAGVYALTGASAAGFTISGNLTLDASGNVTAANLTFNDPAVGTPTFTTVASTGTSGSNPVVDVATITGSTGQIVLDYLQTPDVAGALSLCLYSQTCNASQASYIQIYTPLGFNLLGTANLTAGSLRPATPVNAAATPEPSSLLLLGTGVLIFAVVARRSFTKRPGSHAEGRSLAGF